MEQTQSSVRFVLKSTLLLLIIVLFSACVPVEEPKVEGDGDEVTKTEDQTETETPVVVTPVEESSGDVSDFLNVSAIIGNAVDAYNGQNELLQTRSLVNVDKVDTCDTGSDRFSDQIAYYTKMMMNAVPAKVGIIGEYYGTSSNDANYAPVSLISHPLCVSTSSSLSQTLKKVPSQTVIAKLNKFENEVNALRTQALAGDESARIELMKKWTKVFSCLAYTESLSSADSSSSRSVASANAPSGYVKPSGVEFYNDPAQDAASRLNIGLYQFTPNSSGNIKPCLKAWNEIYSGKPTCMVSESGSQAEMIKILGSSYQSFNAFCGVHKVIQTFSIQVNTSSSGSTFPANSGKSAANRCVTPHFYAGKAYNHFGPFQNSTGDNMNKLYSCIENS